MASACAGGSDADNHHRPRCRALGFGLIVLVILSATSLFFRYSRTPATPSSRPIIMDTSLSFPDVGFVRANPTVPVADSPFRFAEIAGAAGIDFVHFSGMTEAKHFPTAYGSGVAIFDYDNDGQLDLYFATATLLPLGTARRRPEPALQEPGRQPVSGRDRDVGARVRGVLPRDRRSATSTTTAIRTFSCATTARTCSI